MEDSDQYGRGRDSSEIAREQAKKNSEELTMDNAESMKEYIARAKFLALNMKYHGIEVIEQDISRRVLNGLRPAYAPENKISPWKQISV